MAWLDALAHVANTPGGLYVVPEPNDSPEETVGSDEAY